MNVNDTIFLPENIEKAVSHLNDGSSDQSDALNFISEWSSQPSSILTALHLLQNSSNLILSFISSTVIKNKIASYWQQMDNNQKTEYFGTLLTIISAIADLNNNISYNLIIAICNIALFEWPENLSVFSKIFTPQDDEKSIEMSIKILRSFLNEIDNSEEITDFHRSNLRRHIIDNYSDQISLIIKNLILIPHLSADIMDIYSNIISWGFKNDVMNIELFKIIVYQFLFNDETFEISVKLLNNLFNYDITCNFEYTVLLIDALSKIESKSSSFIQFECNFLNYYSPDIEKIFVHTETDEKTQNAIIIESNGFSIEAFHDNLVTVYRELLNSTFSDDYEACSSFFELWESKINRIYREKKFNYSDRQSFNFFIPLFNEIRTSIFYAIYLENDSIQKKIMKKIIKIDLHGFIEFLNQQPPSIILCQSLVIIKEIIQNSTFSDVIEKVLERLIQFSQVETSSDFQGRLMMALSCCSLCFNCKNNFFSGLIGKIFGSFSGNDKILISAATNSLDILVNQNVGLFESNLNNYIEFLIGQSPIYLQNFDLEDAVKVFNSITTLIRLYNRRNTLSFTENDENQSVKILYNRLFEPIIQILNNFDQINIEKALKIISKCCCCSDSNCSYLWDSILPPLFKIAANTIPDLNFSAFSIETILTTVAKVQIGKAKYFEEISTEIENVFNLMKSRGKVEDCFFRYFSMMRMVFSDVDQIYSEIHQHLIVPFLGSGELPTFELFKMLDKFGLDVIDIEWLSLVVIQTIKELPTNVVSVALDVYKKKMKSFSKEQVILFLNKISLQMISTLIRSILNLTHKELLYKMVVMIECIFSELAFKGMFVNDDRKKVIIVFKNIIVSSLKEVAQETQPGLFVNFTDYLVDFCFECFPYKSESIFKELLVMLRRVSPCDAYIFNKKNACDVSHDDDYIKSFEDKIDDKNEKDGLDPEYDFELEPDLDLESGSDLEPDSDLELESD